MYIRVTENTPVGGRTWWGRVPGSGERTRAAAGGVG